MRRRAVARPVSVARGGLTERQGEQLGCGDADERGRRGRLRPLRAGEGQLKARGDQASAEILDRLHAAVESDRDIILVKATGEEVMKTVRQLLTGITGHVKHHLAFVQEKRKALGLAA